MKIAALYDIHGNLPALEAGLEELHRERVTQIVVGGDVLPGPMARETLELLQSSDIPADFIMGNGEVAALAERRGRPSGVPEPYREGIRWSGMELTDDQAKRVGAWPLTLRRRLPTGGDVLFCHATPRDLNEIFTVMTAAEKLAPIFEATDAALVVCGHTHMQFNRRIGRTRVVNAGSVGMPFGATGAHWLLLGDKVELRKTQYDLPRAAERIRRTAYPGAAEFADKNVLSPASAESILQRYAAAELKTVIASTPGAGPRP